MVASVFLAQLPAQIQAHTATLWRRHRPWLRRRCRLLVAAQSIHFVGDFGWHSFVVLRRVLCP